MRLRAFRAFFCLDRGRDFLSTGSSQKGAEAMRKGKIGLGVLAVLGLGVVLSGCFVFSSGNTGKVAEDAALGIGFQTYTGGALAETITAGTPIMINYRTSPGDSERVDLGFRLEPLGLMCFDLRYQVLVDETAHLDGAFEVGMGLSTLLVPGVYSLYGGFTLSKELGPVTPYVHYRYMAVQLDPDLEAVLGSLPSINEIVVGIELKLGDSFAIVPEYVESRSQGLFFGSIVNLGVKIYF